MTKNKLSRQEMTEVDRKFAAAYDRLYKAENTLRCFCEPRRYKAYRQGRMVDVVEWRTIDQHYHWPVIDKAVVERAAALAEIDELNKIFRAAGGWNRYFLVTNDNGHVHNGTNCSTCFSTTQYNWLVDLAGADEAEMVQTYGSDACTVCFPSAGALPGWGSSKSQREKQAAKEDRAAKAAARKAEAEVKRLNTQIREMKGDLRDALASVEFSPVSHAHSKRTNYYEDKIATLPAKIANLTGETVDQILAEVREKARKQAIKDLKECLNGWILKQPSFDPELREKIYANARKDLHNLGVKGF